MLGSLKYRIIKHRHETIWTAFANPHISACVRKLADIRIDAYKKDLEIEIYFITKRTETNLHKGKFYLYM